MKAAVLAGKFGCQQHSSCDRVSQLLVLSVLPRLLASAGFGGFQVLKFLGADGPKRVNVWQKRF